MIVKKADDKGTALAALESLLARADRGKQKFIEDELRMMRAGIKGERESAYHIDFDFSDSEITSVIHDLRLEMGGRVAQIDHLVIHRTHRFYVLETKSFSHGLKITDEGEFLRWNDWKKTFEGMPSPIEQNRRHTEVLRYVLQRLGYLNPEIESFVLISPTARIDRSKLHPCPEVVKADQFTTAFKQRLLASLNSVGGLLGGVSKALFGDSAEEIAKKLVRLHKPINIDYEAKFGMRGASVVAGEIPPAQALLASERAVQIVTENEAWGRNAATAGPSCTSCGSSPLTIEYGKYGYYFKCKACDANTALKIGCEIAGHKEKIRKSKLTFYRECEQCGSSKIFHINEA
jgi:transposase-like protein